MASGRCQFGQATFAGASGNDEGAPIPVIPRDQEASGGLAVK